MSSGPSEATVQTLAPGSEARSELEVKKSRFVAYAAPAAGWAQAQDFLARIRREHPKARHVCHGFRGSGPDGERCSDDGEPSGTAGLPILGAIRSERLSNVVCVVVRYFGGIKLGAGGLIRAYGSAARQVLREAPIVVTTPKASLRVTVDASKIGAVYDAAARTSASPSEEVYGDDGSLTLTLTCEAQDVDDLRLGLLDTTKGDAIIV